MKDTLVSSFNFAKLTFITLAFIHSECDANSIDFGYGLCAFVAMRIAVCTYLVRWFLIKHPIFD